MTKTKGFLATLIVVLTATMMLSTATCCYIHADFGSDSVAVMQQGLSTFTGLSLGNAAFAFSGALLVIDFFVARKNIAWTSVVNCLLCGVFIDVANWALGSVFGLSDGLWYRVILFAVGLGSIAAVFGTGPLIQWMLKFGKKS